MKILQVTGSLELGGLENVAMDCYREAKSQGNKVDFIVFGDREGYYEKEVLNNKDQVFHISQPSCGYRMFYKNVKRIILQNGGYDIVHAHTFFNSGLVLTAAKSANVKRCIAHCHSSRRVNENRIYKKIYNFIMRLLILRNADIYCACSKQAGVCMFGKRNFLKKGIVIVNKIQTEKFKYNHEERKRIRKEFGLDQKDIVIGTVGHLTQAKNQKLLIDIFANLYSGNKEYKLLIVGDGELRENLKRQVRQYEIEKQVVFSGMRTDVNAILSAMDLFILTSKHEGLGIVLLEAQANGLQVLGIEGVIAEEVLVTDNIRLVKCESDNKEWKDIISNSLNIGRDIDKVSFNKVKKLEMEFKDKLLFIYKR